MADQGQGAPLVKPNAPPSQSGLTRIPIWLVSLALHAALFAVLASAVPGLRGGLVGDPDGDFRSIGIYVGHSGDGGEGGGNDAKTGLAEAATQLPPGHPKSPKLDLNNSNELPADANKPRLAEAPRIQTGPPIIGPGTADPQHTEHLEPSAQPQPPPSDASNPASTIGQTTELRGLFGGSDKPPGPRGSYGSTPFFGIWDRGARFIYVIDCSGSMFGHNAMRSAKDELLASLRTLRSPQQFQIVFYNLRQRWMTAPGKMDLGFFTATPINRRMAEQFIAEVQPDDGTDHLPALKRALQLRPDVIFFLTDGGEPGLTPENLAEIRRINGGRARIHCVLFDSAEEPDGRGSDFVRQLADDNNGHYVRRNIAHPKVVRHSFEH